MIVGVPVLAQRWLAARRGETQDAAPPNTFIQIFGPLYLVVLLGLWLSALPDYLGAVDGVTNDGTPRGNLSYAAFCFVGASLSVAAALTAHSTTTAARSREGAQNSRQDRHARAIN